MKRKIGVFMLIGILAVAVLAVGCGGNEAPKSGEEENKKNNNGKPGEEVETVTLYFSDADALHLVSEKREVTTGGETLETIVVRELIKGPEDPEHNKTIPEETKLLSVSVEDNIAYVNFSQEFSTKHWGGSTGETHTLMSVTNSLCELEGIDKVQFLLEGENMSTLAGHWDTSQPLEPQDI